ncbi:MAG: hyperosmotically inducible protein [Motiliproteus sp.]|jgi:hyperosmotically inducible protein
MNYFSIKPIVVACALSMAAAVTPVLAASEDERSSDLWTRAALTTTYTLNRHLNPFKIDIQVQEGVATLRGTVDSDVERDLAEELALGVDGILGVKNELNVSPGTSDPYYSNQQARRDAINAGEDAMDKKRSFMRRVEDANVTARVKSQLLWNSSTSGLSIGVATRNGRVTLRGDVRSDAEAELAEQIARNTGAVQGVENNLRVMGEQAGIDHQAARKAREAGKDISDGWITTKVKSALLYNRNVDGSEIHVDTQNGIVTLRGRVDSDSEKERAVAIARSVKGVKDVRHQWGPQESAMEERQGYEDKDKDKNKNKNNTTTMENGHDKSE